MTARNPRPKKPVVIEGERLIASVGLNPTEEFRLLEYSYRGKPMVNLRRYRLHRGQGQWVHTGTGFMLSEVNFLEVASLVALGAEIIAHSPRQPEEKNLEEKQ